jgi:hypothetical protein
VLLRKARALGDDGYAIAHAASAATTKVRDEGRGGEGREARHMYICPLV